MSIAILDLIGSRRADAESTAAEKISEATRGYLEIIRRNSTPKPGDVDLTIDLMRTLGKTEADLAADISAFQYKDDIESRRPTIKQIAAAKVESTAKLKTIGRDIQRAVANAYSGEDVVVIAHCWLLTVKGGALMLQENAGKALKDADFLYMRASEAVRQVEALKNAQKEADRTLDTIREKRPHLFEA